MIPTFFILPGTGALVLAHHRSQVMRRLHRIRRRRKGFQ